MKMRRISSLLLAVVLIISMTVPAFASDTSITFNGLNDGFAFQTGSEYGNSYTATDLFDNFKNVMPGDELTQTITFTNLATDCDYIKLYMRAVAHDEETNPLTYDEPFEDEDGKDQAHVAGERDETVATMSDFLSQLSMRVFNGEELIYEASPDQLDGLAENVLLGEFRSGEKATLTVKLDVPITLGNEYANRVGEVDWVFTAEGFDEPCTPPDIDCDWITVHKIWKGCDPHPNVLRVNLLRDGEYFTHVYLTPLTQWTWTWAMLDDEHEWTVEEVIPEGYEARYYTFGRLTIITNTKVDDPCDPSIPTCPDPSDPTCPEWPTCPDPSDPTCPEWPTCPDPSDPTCPEWPTCPDPSDPTCPEWPTCPTEPEDPIDPSDPSEPSEPTEPSEPSEPSEPTEPSEPSEPSEPTEPSEPDVPSEPIDLTVRKVWDGDEEAVKDHPDSVKVTLFNGEEAVETVILGQWNDWYYTWEDLAADGEWSVIEIDIPKGYTPSYRTNGNVVTITNTATLIQTGQQILPIVILSGAGLLMLALGAVLLVRRKNEQV